VLFRSDDNSANELKAENLTRDSSLQETLDEGSYTEPERKPDSLNPNLKGQLASGARLISPLLDSTLSPKSTRFTSTGTKILGMGNFSRVFRSPDSDSLKEVGLHFSLLYLDPTQRDSITIVPVESGIPGLTVAVPETEREYLCERSFWKASNVRLGTNLYSDIRPDDRSPFDFFVLQPPIRAFEHTRDVGNIASATFDSTFYPGTLEFAIDVSGDGVADVASIYHCCHDTSTHPDSLTGDRANVDCYTCSSAFHRGTDGTWERTYETGPC
jgi:hypothetical protein